MRPLPAALLDTASVLVFVAAGIRTHAGAVSTAEVAGTAWPFLAALVTGWLGVRAWRAPAAVMRTGVPVWLVTAAAGLLLRGLAGDGVAPAFALVAFVVLAGLLLGWRSLLGVLSRRSPVRKRG